MSTEREARLAAAVAAEALTLENVLAFIKRQRTWFKFEVEGDALEGSTRDHGNVGEETAGVEDIREAKRLTQLIHLTFGNGVVIGYDVGEEWVNLTVRLSARGRQGGERYAGQIAPLKIVQDAKRLRGDLGQAWREMQNLVRQVPGGVLGRMSQEALVAIREAVEAVEALIGAGESEHVDQQTGFISRDRQAAQSWSGVAAMVKDIEAMSDQCVGWMQSEQRAVDSGQAGFRYNQYYGHIQDVLDTCAEKLRRLERFI